MKFILCVLIAVSGIFNCQDIICQNNKKETKGTSHNDVVTIQPQVGYQKMPIDIAPYLDSIHYVRLETTDDALIGNLTNVEVYKDRIYVLDDKTLSLFIFDLNGNYLSKIHSIGNGPEEYIQLDYLAIDMEQDQLVLTDLGSFNILYYTLDGKFIKRQKEFFKSMPGGMTPLDNKKTARFTGFEKTEKAKHNLVIRDSNMQIEKSYYPYIWNSQEHLWPANTINGNNFLRNNNKYTYFSSLSDTIFHITSKGLFPEYRVDMGKYSFDASCYTKDIDDLKNYLKNGTYATVFTFFETKNWVIINYHLNKYGYPFYCFYHKTDGKTICGNEIKNQDVDFYLDNLAVFNDFFVTYTSPSSILHEDSPINEKERKQIMKLRKTLTEEDNPVLIFYKLKD
ncbi:6-bladed beta-propeller [Parabacteroides sp. AM08-6]|uniref:6-bladed beta-propeller n=1 Tax=Parabacteroides sp. AM08-6 TaxID=2292053 RepID=UPI000EFFFF6F|nr:6-bladed beta-propeller [Parabacteroides sp. AM08-6]RHJ82379.1 6-bladed beta-propeller [Parabacteroides sp. AM08-6]